MKQTFIALIFFCITIQILSQEENRKIRYYFGSKIDTVLKISIDSNIIKLDDKESYVISCDEGDSVIYISLHTYCSSCDIFDSIGEINYWLGYLVHYSNRFYLINDLQIPIVFSGLDKQFGVIKMLNEEKGYFRKSIQLFPEFGSQVNIITNRKCDKIYDIEYIR